MGRPSCVGLSGGELVHGLSGGLLARAARASWGHPRAEDGGRPKEAGRGEDPWAPGQQQVMGELAGWWTGPGLPDRWCLNLAQRWWRLRTVLGTQIWDTRRSWFEGSTWPQLSDTAESVHSWEWGLGLLASPSDSSRGARGKNYFCCFPFPVSFSYRWMGEFPRRCMPGEAIALKRWHVRLGFKHVLLESLTRSLLINMHTDTKSSLGMLNIKRSRCLEMAALRYFSLRAENGSLSRGQAVDPLMTAWVPWSSWDSQALLGPPLHLAASGSSGLGWRRACRWCRDFLRDFWWPGVQRWGPEGGHLRSLWFSNYIWLAWFQNVLPGCFLHKCLFLNLKFYFRTLKILLRFVYGSEHQ